MDLVKDRRPVVQGMLLQVSSPCLDDFSSGVWGLSSPQGRQCSCPS